ncbi:DUF1007 family protein [Ahrensia marina]|uniref:DUF1007 family protein n=1 Tax=Ahrensia marina TaxID=1514904 RepID=UPI0006B4B6C0|nr:DUF1007 family protein [Ahrensia marina]
MFRHLAILLTGTMFVAGLPAAANAHPHVFAQARMELKSTPQGTIEELRHVWRFDELFTATVMIEFDMDESGDLNDEELDVVANTVSSSIADFNYFQNIEVNDQDIGFKKVTEMAISVEDGQLLILFSTVPAEEVALKDAPKIGVFDPTFYTAIEFYSEDDMVLIDAPKGCSRTMVVPDPDEAIEQNQQSLTEAFYDTTENDMSKILATRMEVTCS